MDKHVYIISTEQYPIYEIHTTGTSGGREIKISEELLRKYYKSREEYYRVQDEIYNLLLRDGAGDLS